MYSKHIILVNIIMLILVSSFCYSITGTVLTPKSVIRLESINDIKSGSIIVRNDNDFKINATIIGDYDPDIVQFDSVNVEILPNQEHAYNYQIKVNESINKTYGISVIFSNGSSNIALGSKIVIISDFENIVEYDYLHNESSNNYQAGSGILTKFHIGFLIFCIVIIIYGVIKMFLVLKIKKERGE